MGLVVSIALGIVLAVIILRYLGEIVSLSILLLLFAIFVACGLGILFLVVEYPDEVVGFISTAIVVIGGIVGNLWVSQYPYKRALLDIIGETLGMVLTLLLVLAGFAIAYFGYAEQSSPIIAGGLLMAAIVGYWFLRFALALRNAVSEFAAVRDRGFEWSTLGEAVASDDSESEEPNH